MARDGGEKPAQVNSKMDAYANGRYERTIRRRFRGMGREVVVFRGRLDYKELGAIKPAATDIAMSGKNRGLKSPVLTSLEVSSRMRAKIERSANKWVQTRMVQNGTRLARSYWGDGVVVTAVFQEIVHR